MDFIKKAWITGAGLCVVLATGTAAPIGRAQETKTDTDTPSNAKSEKVSFLRIKKSDSGEPETLQVAIARYEFLNGRNEGAYVDLIGAVHIGTKSYYKDLNRRFKDYDAMLYELVADPSVNKPQQRAERGFNPLGMMQTGMKDVLQLTFQLEEVDYTPANFVHADMSPEDFLEDMNKRGDGFVSMFARMMGAGLVVQNSKKGASQQADMMAAMLSKDTIKLRRVMAEQFESMDSQMAGLADKSGKSTLLTERNTKAFQVMEKQLQDGKKKLAIFYGAGHLLDMHRRLIHDYQATQTKIEWLDAWPLSK
ncbi:MAG: hypothetical protein ABL921_20605 [Pirellula sp.]